jgi:hypothetical protein
MSLGSPVIGFRDGIFEVGEFRKGSFFLSDLSLKRKYNRKWFMLVYVPEATLDIRVLGGT